LCFLVFVSADGAAGVNDWAMSTIPSGVARVDVSGVGGATDGLGAAGAHPRREELRTLVEITDIPTAAGREQRVVRALEAWIAARPGLKLVTDAAGNMLVSIDGAQDGTAPLLITAHLDHPAFVIERAIGPGTFEVSFRGGVHDLFFKDAPIVLLTGDDRAVRARLIGEAGQTSPAGKHYLAEVLDGQSGKGLNVGDIGRWEMPGSEIIDGVLHAPACDDLAALAAALCAMDGVLKLRAGGKKTGDVRLLFTRAEEIGFVGAIAACKLGTIPKGSRLLALENSRAFADSPIGGGPIVRVGDRISVFTPWLTSACAQRAEEVFNGPATARASDATSVSSKRPWQRKLMAGGACEASVFCSHGYEATCICLPLGNYHNMPWLTEVQEGRYDEKAHGPARCAREFIHTEDYLGMVDLLVALGEKLPGGEGFLARLDKMYEERRYVL